MACYPKIDQPCPLGTDVQRRLDGWCGRCGAAVHALDAMDDAARLAFVRDAEGPMCVSYRVAARGATLGLGAALLFAAPVAHARDAGPVSPPAHDASTIAQTQDGDASAHEELVFVGGIDDPASVEFVDADDALPDLPIIRETGHVAAR